ncbi:hypothetical protein RJ639_047346 [Escallonia herrerae]|uniref:DNA-directed RNA polymerase I subunit RPA1 n=1 Tax=Escallonia herrerae TaxID=1293975 RepID=A0AA88W953_9ASTE|nr:hypothetical protein RJ639_047346 [Escallonia herrerae]
MQGASESVEAVRFSFMTDEEVRKHSVLKVTNPVLLNAMEKPVPGGLYDPALGPLDDQTSLRNICLYEHLRADRLQVETCTSQLEMIAKGDILGAKALEAVSLGEPVQSEESDGSHVSCSTVHSGAQSGTFQHQKKQSWTSLQFTEARSVLNKFLKPKFTKCESCGAKNPKVTTPAVGLFYANDMSGAKRRGNIIRGSKLEEPYNGGEDKTSSEVIDVNDCTWDNGCDTAEISSFTATSDGIDDSTRKKGVKKKAKVSSDYQKEKDFSSRSLLLSEVKDMVKRLWENEAELCSFICDFHREGLNISSKTGHSMFFLEAVLVPPIKFRPASKSGDSVMEHPHTVLLGKVLQLNLALGNILANQSERSNVVKPWMDLQRSINGLFDKKTATGPGQRDAAPGICQLLEKKEGIFRQKMMGKRVNYACRSVISPDPYLAVNEIGIPPYFALRLTYPERVTPWNVVKLRDAIVNGSDSHPGATHYADKVSTKKLPPSKKKRVSISRKLPSSRGVATQAANINDYDFEGKIVYRHLQDGDIVLVNRQCLISMEEVGGVGVGGMVWVGVVEEADEKRIAVVNGDGSYIIRGWSLYMLILMEEVGGGGCSFMWVGGVEVDEKRMVENGDLGCNFLNLFHVSSWQPTLHKPSIMAHVVRVLKGEKTLRMHYANCSTYNADFDGDEMNVHFPQDEISRAEAYDIINANNQYIVPTRGDPVRGLIQDHIVSAVLLTMKSTFLTRDEYNQLLYSSGVFVVGSSSGNLHRKISVIDSEGAMQPVLPAVWKPRPLWTGKQVITAVLNHLTRGCRPCTVKNDGKIPHGYFAISSKVKEDTAENEANKAGENNASKVEEENAENKFLIWKNELVCGVIDKAQFGKYGLVHTVQEIYGSNIAGVLLSALGRLFTVFLQIHGFTCGVDDLIVLPKWESKRKEKFEGEDVGEKVHCEFVQFNYGEIGPRELQLEIEKAICNDRLSAIAHLDMKMRDKLSQQGSEISSKLLRIGLLKPFPNNCISLMTISGAKGSTVNFQQISSCLGQQELEGKRVPRMVSGKTLPCFPPWDFSSRAGGFISDRFLTGLHPQEYYFHCMAGREGLVDTAVKTSRSGYLQRCLVKNLESLKVCYDYTVRDADGSIIQFHYGEDGVDVHKTSFLHKFEALAANQEGLCEKYYQQLEFGTYIEELPDGLRKKAKAFVQNFLTEEHGSSKRKKQEDFLMLVKQKYLSSLAQSGEPVGIIAAQSVGEPSTQMTVDRTLVLRCAAVAVAGMGAGEYSSFKNLRLNTFHLAGRGEMNVTLGIPRLQEILMTASTDIKTPIITCPLLDGGSKDDARTLAKRIKKVTVADMIETIEVSVLPSIHNHEICRTYKLKVMLKEHELISVEDCEVTLCGTYIRELEDAIENHMNLLSRISGFKNFMPNLRSEASSEKDEDASGSRSQENDDDDNDNEEDDDGRGEDLGLDAQKRKRQATDEIDYEDGSEDESFAAQVTDTDQADDGIEIREDVENRDSDVDKETMPDEHITISKRESSDRKAKLKATRKKKVKANLDKKENDRRCLVQADGLHLEVHFRFTDEPHILLNQIAQKVAKKVSIKSCGKIDQCRIFEYKAAAKQVILENKVKPGNQARQMDQKKKSKVRSQKNKKESDSDGDSGPWALKAAGVDFTAFWGMEDQVDVSRLYSNNIHVMLKTFGVEAARETIIKEVTHVFQLYGVEIDYRHLSLIADYMTHTGGYRPMSRHGGIAESTSPFLKMSFETASKFIVEAASHGMTDTLDTPSARICLGLPAKVGTGCFDLMLDMGRSGS